MSEQTKKRQRFFQNGNGHFRLVCCVDLIKVVLGTLLIRKKIWVVNMVYDR